MLRSYLYPIQHCKFTGFVLCYYHRAWVTCDITSKKRNHSLRSRRNLTPFSNVCEVAPRSLFWAPSGLNELPEMRFEFPFNLIGKSIMDFNWPIMARILGTQVGV